MMTKRPIILMPFFTDKYAIDWISNFADGILCNMLNRTREFSLEFELNALYKSTKSCNEIDHRKNKTKSEKRKQIVILDK